MSSVFVTTYEVTPAGLPIIEAHNAAVKAWKEAGWLLAEELGGEGFQPGWSGIRAILFRGEAPEGWRVLERDPRNRELFRCVPRRSTKKGKELARRLADAGTMPKGEDVAPLFGWSPNQMAMSGTTIYFPTTLSVDFPAPRHFVRLPRFAEDGWEGHGGLSAVPESEFMRAIEIHNAEVARVNAEQVA